VVKQQLQACRPIETVAPDTLPDDVLVTPTATMGAPTALLEKIPLGQEPIRALRCVEEARGRRATATMPTEVGGINAPIPLPVGARDGLPVVDADGQGRAFPELQMETVAIEGIACTPMGTADENGDHAAIRTDETHRMEWIARGITIRCGGSDRSRELPGLGRRDAARLGLVARAGDDLLALVPDIITGLDAETAVPITGETLRYGQRVVVIAVRVPVILRSPAALRPLGPAALGLDEI
jgi:DUF917 family protein